MVKWIIRIVLALAVGFILFCGLYFVKSRLPFEFSKTRSIHQYFPFKYLVPNDTFPLTGPGPVLEEDFNKWVYFSRWYHLWAKDGDKVEVHPEDNGFNGSGALSVVSRSSRSWSMSPPIFIEVAPGTQVLFEAMLYRDFLTLEAGLRLTGFDRAKKSADIRLSTVDLTGKPGQWEKISLTYTAAEGIAYVTPRIRGKGMGRLKMDNIRVSRK